VVAVPVDVEAGAARVSFTVSYPEGDEVWIYLVDPTGAAVSPIASGVTHVHSPAPHEFVLVRRPKAGRWTMVLVRARPGRRVVAKALAGGEHPQLHVVAGCPASSPSAAPVAITASASWKHHLTGINATATVTTPAGARHHISLRDDSGQRPANGRYIGYFTPAGNGRHEILVSVRGSAAATIADPVGRLLHATTETITSVIDSPPFVRHVPLQCWIGDPPPPADPPKEHPTRASRARPRPKTLVSATWAPRRPGRR
jgi:hypothetical protein